MRRCLACSAAVTGPSWDCTACGFTPERHATYTSFISGDGRGGFEGHFFDHLVQDEPGFWWFESRNDLIAWALRRWFADMRSFLEIGCGTGFVVSRVAREFPDVRIAASELFGEAMPHVARRVPEAELYELDAREIPFREEFDVVGAFDVIEHIDEDERVLDEVGRALRPGGGLIVTVPQHPWLWSSNDDYAHHKRRYTRGSLGAVLERTGYRIIAMRSFVALLMPLLVASRLTAQRALQHDPRAEFRISRTVNAALTRVMALERAAIRRGVSFPIGGSLLAVAQRRI